MPLDFGDKAAETPAHRVANCRLIHRRGLLYNGHRSNATPVHCSRSFSPIAFTDTVTWPVKRKRFFV